MPTKVWQVQSGDDDCRWQTRTEGWTKADKEAYVGRGGDVTEHGGMRFVNIDIPKGAAIISAFLTVYCEDWTGTSSGVVVRAKIRGEANDNAQPFSTEADYHARPKTIATVLWHNIPPWNNYTWYTSPNISTIIQEIISRQGWNNGNSLVIFLEDDGSDPYSEREYRQYEWAQHQYAAKLEITWEELPGYSLAVNSAPLENILVKVDGVEKGTTPIALTILEGEHIIEVPEEVEV